jgi:hypothetical protein
MFTSTKLYQELIKKLKTFGCVLTEHLGDPQLEAVHLFFFFHFLILGDFFLLVLVVLHYYD